MSNDVDILCGLAKQFDVVEVAEAVLKDGRFRVWSGSSNPNVHHYGKGGLAQHTREVVQLCSNSNYYFKTLKKNVDEQLLFLAGLFHDIGKVYDYEPIDMEYKDWKPTSHKRCIHHLNRSALVWQAASQKFKQEDRDDVLHAILAHHGRPEWGSAIRPATRLAWMLHLCDSLSARMDDCRPEDIFLERKNE